MNITDSIKDSVRALRAYTLSPDRASVKLNQNENPWDAPLAIKQETLQRLHARAWSRYPDFSASALQERLAAFSGWKADGVLAGNGSNELIQALLMVTVSAGKKVLINEPTFALYRQITTVLGGEVISVPLAPSLSFDGAALQAAIREKDPDVVIICSPNNPTGCVLETASLAGIIKTTRGLVVVDEAYFEFSQQTAVPLLAQHKNLVVLRTFSKAMALAGLRVGYLLADQSLVVEIAKALLPYNLNFVSQTAAEVAIGMYETELAPLVQTMIGERERLYREIGEINGLTPVPSRANFMVVHSTIEPKQVFRELLQRDILIRDVSGYPMLKDYFRISVGTPSENDALLKALRQIFADEKGT